MILGEKDSFTIRLAFAAHGNYQSFLSCPIDCWRRGLSFKIEAISTASEAECVELGMKLKGKDEGKMFNCLTKEQMSIWLTKLYGTGTGFLR